MPQRRLLHDSTVYLAANITSRVIGFVMIPFYARFLNTEQYGTLNLLELATTVIALIFGLQSIGPALTRIYAEQSSEQAKARVVSTAMISTILLAGLIALAAIALANPIAAAVSLPGQGALLRLAIAAMFSSAITEIALVYQRMQNRAYFYLVYALVTLTAMLGGNIALIGFAHQGVWGFVYSKLAVTSLGALYLIVRIGREVGIAWGAAAARAMARFAGPLVISGVATFVIHFSDRLFLAHVSKAEVGVYALAYNFAFLLSILIGDSFNKTWAVSLYDLAAEAGWQARFARIARWFILVLGAGSIGISLFARDVLILMVPASYDPPDGLLPLLVFAYFLREIGEFFGKILLIGIGSGLVGRISLAGASLNLALNMLLIGRFGIWGAAWATFGTWAAYCAVCWVMAWRVHKFILAPWPLLQVLAFSGAGLWARRALEVHNALARLALDVTIFAAFLALVTVVFLNQAERSQAKAMLRSTIVLIRKRILPGTRRAG